MKLYDCSTAPSPRRVRIFIAEEGLDIPTVQVDLRKGEHLPAPLRLIDVPKPDGEHRRLAIPSIVDRVVQTIASQQAMRSDVVDDIVSLVDARLEKNRAAA